LNPTVPVTPSGRSQAHPRLDSEKGPGGHWRLGFPCRRLAGPLRVTGTNHLPLAGFNLKFKSHRDWRHGTEATVTRARARSAIPQIPSPSLVSGCPAPLASPRGGVTGRPLSRRDSDRNAVPAPVPGPSGSRAGPGPHHTRAQA
jgi:hypothetical protein